MNEVNKEILATPYCQSDGKMSVLDAGTGSFKQVSETNVLGRFVKMKQLNGYKSREAGRPVYDVVDVCQIKINTSASKDVVSHNVAGQKGEELKKRFSTAWVQYEALLAAQNAAAKKAEEEAKAQAKRAQDEAAHAAKTGKK